MNKDNDDHQPEPQPGPSRAPEPTAATTSKSRKNKKKDAPKWRQTSTDTAWTVPDWLGHMEPATTIKSPVEYFQTCFSSDILQHIVDQSNLYSVQKNLNNNLNLCVSELEQFIESLLAMSLVKLSSSRLYWSGKLNCPLVSQVMSRDRWEQIKSNLHFNDNSNYVASKDDPNYDKLFKIRPLVTHLTNKFNEIPKPQRLCVDEQMIPFKGISSLKQYMPLKPVKWGYKVHCLCGEDGIMYDFVIYKGKIEPLSDEPDLGASSNIVVNLARTIPNDLNHLLYFDRWFTSLPLQTHLASKGIYSLGTVNVNRLPGIAFASDKEFLQTGRGSYQEKSTVVDACEVRAVKWMDNRSVTLLSTFASAEPLNECKRYDKKEKKSVIVPCPAIVQEYNQFMGGVDLMDALIALYRIHYRSKKYCHKFFFHFVDVTGVNCWLLYRRDCKDMEIPAKNVMKLQEFKLSLAEALLLEGKRPCRKKRGRPSNAASVSLQHDKKLKSSPATKAIPSAEVRTDGYHHFADVVTRGRCKNPGCKAAPVFFCNKCQVHFCITKNKNCFKEFHTK